VTIGNCRAKVEEFEGTTTAVGVEYGDCSGRRVLGWLECGMKCEVVQEAADGQVDMSGRQAHSAADMQVGETRQGGVRV
jgi:hypothetical protein